MKQLFLALMTLAATAFSQGVTIFGQQGVATPIYWGTATDSTLKAMWLVDKHYHDSAGTWVRDDNRADSCSRPFRIATSGGAHPIWKYELETRRRSKDATDSGTIVYRVETRNIRNFTNGTNWGWRRKGMVSGYVDVAIQDSVVLPAPMVTTKSTIAGLFFVTGDEARLCPDELPGTANVATDSIFDDTTTVRWQ